MPALPYPSSKTTTTDRKGDSNSKVLPKKVASTSGSVNQKNISSNMNTSGKETTMSLVAMIVVIILAFLVIGIGIALVVTSCDSNDNTINSTMEEIHGDRHTLLNKTSNHTFPSDNSERYQKTCGNDVGDEEDATAASGPCGATTCEHIVSGSKCIRGWSSTKAAPPGFCSSYSW